MNMNVYRVTEKQDFGSPAAERTSYLQLAERTPELQE